MTLDTLFFYTFLLAFVRTGAMMASAPLFGGAAVPVSVRVGLSAVIAMALAPVLRAKVGLLPQDVLGLIGCVSREVVIGLLIGSLVTLLLSSAEMAGQFLDLQIGFGSINVLNPQNSATVTILGSFKMQLAVVLFLCLNGHHLLLDALVKSYDLAPGVGMTSLKQISGAYAALIGNVIALGIQIAAPAGATLVVVDMALAAVSRAVPQMNVFVVGAPAKIILGLMAIALGLPALAWAVSYLISVSGDQLMLLFKAMR